MSDDATHSCPSCTEPVSINASRCPHCHAPQLTNKGAIAILILIGAALVPVTLTAAPVALSYGIPSGFAAGVAAGIAWTLVLAGPVCLLVAMGAYQQRRAAR